MGTCVEHGEVKLFAVPDALDQMQGRDRVLHVPQFPDDYVVAAHAATGSLDEISWMTAHRFGAERERVPSGAGLYVRGWAINLVGTAPAPKVFLAVDGSRTYEARVGASRNDVAKTFENDALEFSGFEAIIPTGRLLHGSHTLEVAVADPEARTYANLPQGGSFQITFDGDELPRVPRREIPSAGVIDEIADASTNVAIEFDTDSATVASGRSLYLRGWACLADPYEPFLEMYVLVDNRQSHRARYGIARPDVAAGMGNPAIESVGFDVRFSTVGLQRGTHLIECLGLSRAGNFLVRHPTLRLTVR